MRPVILAIYDKDEIYTMKLVEYFSQREKGLFEIHGFTKWDSLVKYEFQIIDILLISQDFNEEDIKNLHINITILLAETQEIEATMFNHYIYKVIYKYQPAQRLLHEIMNYYAEEGNLDLRPCNQGRKCKLLAVYSPAGRCYKTTFSLVMGQLLSENHLCLYINLEAYSGFAELLQKNYQENMADLLYYFREKKTSISIKLKSMIHKIGGLDYIPPFQNMYEMLLIQEEEWVNLLATIAQTCNYEFIILDMGVALQGCFSILEQCNKIYIPLKNEEIFQAKYKEFLHTIELLEQNNIKENLMTIQIPNMQVQTIPFHLQNLSAGEYGSFVQQYIQEVIHQ